jgi:4-hydroxybenzoate polyprenyltransferase
MLPLPPDDHSPTRSHTRAACRPGPPDRAVTSPAATRVRAVTGRRATAAHASSFRAYVEIARPDHWFKNVFMLLGILLALFYRPELLTPAAIRPVGLAIAATCLIASSNYVLNELVDGPRDRLHPDKRHRPVPSGRVSAPAALLEWALLAVAGLGLAFSANVDVGLAGIGLWAMGVIYNVPPVRTKEWPYLDVLSESLNNPLRLLLGWFAIETDHVPPLSLVLAYWMVGAFFMTVKRYAEYRRIDDRQTLAAYRGSFAHYTEERLLLSLLFYATTCALFLGIFIVRYHLELILFVPAASGLFAVYLRLGMKPDSPAQRPERLYRERGFVLYVAAISVLFVVLMFTRIPALYHWFNVEPAGTAPLWTLGRR